MNTQESPCHLLMYFDQSRLVLGEDVGDDSPPIEFKDEERRQVFHLREQLGRCGMWVINNYYAIAISCLLSLPVRTPPKPVNLRPFEPPRDSPPTVPALNDFKPVQVR